MHPAWAKPGIRPTRVNGETIVSHYKSWQHLRLWTIVSLRMRDTPPFGEGRCGEGSGGRATGSEMLRAVGPFPPRELIGGGPKERGSLAFSHRATPPSARQHNWRKGSNSSRNMHILTIWKDHLAEGVAGPKWSPAVREGTPEK